jgi:SulP family sulfate permease
VVSLAHSAVLLLAVLVLAPVLARVPMAALGGILAVTAWRMNDWHEIRQIFGRRFKSAVFAFVSTMVATVALDLTQAIIIGVGLSALIFVFQISRSKIVKVPVSVDKMRHAGYEMRCDPSNIVVVYVVGPLFFGTANTFSAAMENLNGARDVVLSLRTVPLLDTTGINVLETLIQRIESRGGKVYLSGLNDPVRSYLERAGILQHLGEDHVFWSGDQAIIAADRYRFAKLSTGEQKVVLNPSPV